MPLPDVDAYNELGIALPEAIPDAIAQAGAARQVWRPSGARAYATMLGRVYPVIGDRPIASRS